MGNVGRDPRVRIVDGTTIADFSLATSERRRIKDAKGNDGDIAEITEWHNIVMMGRNAEFAEKYIRKGSRLLVEGKLRTRSWTDHNALHHTITEIYVDTFEIVR